MKPTELQRRLVSAYNRGQADMWRAAIDVVEAAVLAEREACAKVCDDKHDYMCSRAAAAIRARGNHA